MEKASQKEVIAILMRGGVGVLPTDTLYGLVGCALSQKAVARIYRLRKRDPKKPCIILISSLRDLTRFGVKADAQTKRFLNTVWPGKVSVVLPCPLKKFAYVHRGTKTLAFRMPKNALLQRILRKTGPLVAPSANIEGMPSATTITEAKRYFGEAADFYMNAGRRVSAPSTLVAVEHGRIVIKRHGSAKVKIDMVRE
ncbi:threonylcarbamoyl-AMP synthase [Candidatus Azambacteria bacterium]|nr:threonylcarbamoyl-AMP synthase [Candidatus Azambacteria bacterium]